MDAQVLSPPSSAFANDISQSWDFDPALLPEPDTWAELVEQLVVSRSPLLPPQEPVQSLAAPQASNAAEKPWEGFFDSDAASANGSDAIDQLSAELDASFPRVPNAAELPAGNSDFGDFHFFSAAQPNVAEQLHTAPASFAQQPAGERSGRADSPQGELDEAMAMLDAMIEPEQQSAAQGPVSAPIVAMMQLGFQQPGFGSGAPQQAQQQTVQPLPNTAAQASLPAANLGWGFQLPQAADLSWAQPHMAAPASIAPEAIFADGLHYQQLPQAPSVSVAQPSQQNLQPQVAVQASFAPVDGFLPRLPFQQPLPAFSGPAQAPVRAPPQLAPRPAAAQRSHGIAYAEMDGPTQKHYLERIEQMLRDEHGFLPKRGRSNPSRERREMVELLARGEMEALRKKLHRFASRGENQTKNRGLKKAAASSGAGT